MDFLVAPAGADSAKACRKAYGAMIEACAATSMAFGFGDVRRVARAGGARGPRRPTRAARRTAHGRRPRPRRQKSQETGNLRSSVNEQNVPVLIVVAR